MATTYYSVKQKTDRVIERTVFITQDKKEAVTKADEIAERTGTPTRVTEVSK
jgi:DNA-binding IscR family transcriptional regulator